MRKFYVDNSLVTFREFVRLAYPYAFSAIINWLPIKMGLVKWPLNAVYLPETTRDLHVAQDELPAEFASFVSTAMYQHNRLKLVDSTIELAKTDMADGTSSSAVHFCSRHVSENYFVQSSCGIYGDKFRESINQVYSITKTGDVYATKGGRKTYDPPSWVRIVYDPKASLAKLIQIHENTISPVVDNLVRLQNTSDVVKCADDFMFRTFDYFVSRGVYTESDQADPL